MSPIMARLFDRLKEDHDLLLDACKSSSWQLAGAVCKNVIAQYRYLARLIREKDRGKNKSNK